MVKAIKSFCKKIEQDELQSLFLDIVERAENGKQFKNLKNIENFFSEEETKILKPSIIYGTLLRARTDRVFEVKGSEGDLLGVYRIEDDAKNKVSRAGGSYRSIDVEMSVSCRDFLKQLKVRNLELAELLSQGGGFITNKDTIQFL